MRDDLLDAYVRRYWGLGGLEAPIWFVGMEEGGEHETSRFNQLLEQWDRNGRPLTTYIEPPEDRSKRKWFGVDHPPLQPTWAKIIRTILSATGEDISIQRIRSYQSWELARPGSAACLLELMPLPSQNVSKWSYGTRSKLSYLRSRAEYLERIAPLRVSMLRDLIDASRPSSVVFYGTSYMRFWRSVAGEEMSWDAQSYGWRTTVADIHLFCVKHPAAPGTRNELFHQLGHDIAPILSSRKNRF